MLGALFDPIAKLHGWVTGKPVGADRQPSLRILGDTADCPRLPPDEVYDVQRDMQRMNAVLTSGATGRAAMPLARSIETLLALPLLTDEARRLRMTLISVRLEAASEAGSDMERAEYRRLIERLLARTEAPMLMSEDYGRLLGRRALYAYQDGPPGSDLDQMLDRVGPQLKLAAYFHPAFGDVHLQLGLGAYMSGHCEEGRLHLERVVMLSENPDMVRAELGRLLRPDMNVATCAQVRALLRRNTIDSRGWRD